MASTTGARRAARTAQPRTNDDTVYLVERRVVAADLIDAWDATDATARDHATGVAEAALAKLDALGGAWIRVGEAPAPSGQRACDVLLEGRIAATLEVVGSDYRWASRRYVSEGIPIRPKQTIQLVYGSGNDGSAPATGEEG